MALQGGSRWKAAVDEALRRRVSTVSQLLEETLSALPDEVSWYADDMSW